VTAGVGPHVSGTGVADLIAALAADAATVATAESISGGRLVASLTSVPGSSAVVRGSVVAYATDVKTSMLGVDPVLLAEQGAVCAEVAEQMAAGVRDRLSATYGVSTTGEAGPDSASGTPVGTVFIAVAGPQGTVARRIDGTGTREQIQRGAVEGALRLLADVRAGGAGTQGTGMPGAGTSGEDGPREQPRLTARSGDT
jgi:PncC family amidohydrolase